MNEEKNSLAYELMQESLKTNKITAMRWFIAWLITFLVLIGSVCFIIWLYNDNYDLVKENDELALKMAHNWLNDIDSGDNKLYNYWKYVIKRD